MKKLRDFSRESQILFLLCVNWLWDETMNNIHTCSIVIFFSICFGDVQFDEVWKSFIIVKFTV